MLAGRRALRRALSKCCAGARLCRLRRAARKAFPSKTNRTRRERKRPNADSHRHRRLGGPKSTASCRLSRRMTQAASEFGAKFEFITAAGHVDRSDADLSGHSLGASQRLADRRAHRRGRARPYPYRHRRPDRLLTRRYCPQEQAHLHHELPYALSRIYRGAHRPAGKPELRRLALFSCALGRGDGARRRRSARSLTRRGFARVRLWTRGVNHGLFRPRPRRALDLPGPIFLSVGRLAVEKNLEALLKLDLPGSTVIVGDGPARRSLQRAYPAGAFSGRALWRGAGGRLCERRRICLSLAHRHVRHRADRSAGERPAGCGLPRFRGPSTWSRRARACLTRICGAACLRALAIPREAARQGSLRFTWQESARQFLENIEASRSSPPATARAPQRLKPKAVSPRRTLRARIAHRHRARLARLGAGSTRPAAARSTRTRPEFAAKGDSRLFDQGRQRPPPWRRSPRLRRPNRHPLEPGPGAAGDGHRDVDEIDAEAQLADPAQRLEAHGARQQRIGRVQEPIDEAADDKRRDRENPIVIGLPGARLSQRRHRMVAADERDGNKWRRRQERQRRQSARPAQRPEETGCDHWRAAHKEARRRRTSWRNDGSRAVIHGASVTP